YKRDDQVRTNQRQRAPRQDHAAVRGAREGRKSALDLAGIEHVDRAQLNTEGRRHGLERAPLAGPRGYGGIPNDGRPRDARRDLFEQFQPLRADKYSNVVKPVTLPPGRARLSPNPAPTGSGVCVNTIGTVRVACSNDGMTAPPPARMTSGVSAANSAAYLRMRSASPAPQRLSIRRLRPSVQPDCCSPCTNALRRDCPSGSS